MKILFTLRVRTEVVSLVVKVPAPVVADDKREDAVRQLRLVRLVAGKKQVQHALLAEERALPPRPPSRDELPKEYQLVPRQRQIARPAAVSLDALQPGGQG